MAKSRARFLSELLGTTGLVKKSKSALAGADEIIDLSTLPSIPNSKLTNSSITINSNATSLGGSVTLTTANVAENTNLYYTDARADARIAAADTGDLSEGSNLYYTNARADARVNLQTGSNLDLSSKNTGDLSEGSNLYYTNARADARIAAASTSDLSEGTNLYYTDARADARVALIVDSAPGTLNTLNELAAALGDDANFSTTVTNSIATKLPLAGGTMTGTLNMGANAITSTGTISSGALSITGKLTQDANGSVNSVNIHDDDASGQPGIHITNALTGYTKEFYLKTYGSGVVSTVFGSSIANKSILATAGAADQGLLIGTLTSKSVVIGTSNAAKITIPSSGAINFHNQPLTSIGTISSGAITSSGAISGTNGTFSGSVALSADSSQLQLGTGNRAQIFHNSAALYLRTSTGSVIVQASALNHYSADASTLYFSAASGGLSFGGTQFLTSSRNLTNIGTISSGAITSSGDFDTSGIIKAHRSNSNVAPPNTANHAQGTRISFYDTSATAWYAMGIESNTLWFNSDTNYKWYEDGSLRMSLTGANLSVTGTLSSGAITSSGTGAFSGKLTISNASYANHLELVRGSDTLYLTPSGGQLLTNGGLSPDVTNQDDLGRTDKYWQDLWLGTSLKMGGQTVIDTNRNLTNIGTISSGAITSTGAVTGTYFSDGYVTWNAAQFNRSGAAIEFQFTPTNANWKVKIGANGDNPTEFNAYTGDADFSGEVSTPSAKLKAIAESNTDTAVDVFVYDTRKDSDGGAWRKRTQNTSWYNETLNTSTRGARKEFPCVAVLVLESRQLTIYDGDDPDMPIWMVFDVGGSNAFMTMLNRGSNDVASVQVLNGVMAVGALNQNNHSGGVRKFNFIADYCYIHDNNNTYTGFHKGGGIANRNSQVGNIPDTEGLIVARNVNDVAMTVLPNAPIDADTGLPVPTIAVATNGGVSVIKDDGNVYDSSDTNAYGSVEFIDGRIVSDRNTSDTRYFISQKVSTIAADSWNLYEYYTGDFSTGYPLLRSDTGSSIITKAKDHSVRGSNVGLSFWDWKESDNDSSQGAYFNNSLMSYVTSDYNTGWMNGDIKLATLSDTDTTNAASTDLLGGIGNFTDSNAWTVPSGWSLSSNIATGSAVTAYLLPASNGILTTGKQYAVTVTQSSYTSGTVYMYMGTGAPGGNYYSNLPSTTGTYTFILTAYNSNFGIYGANYTGVIDNVTISLAEEDRSVKGKGLQVFGTVTKSAVATGAELVGYYGWGTNNYFEQPYNGQLDFGAGDFSMMWWQKKDTLTGSTAAVPIEFSNPDSDTDGSPSALVFEYLDRVRFYTRGTSGGWHYIQEPTDISPAIWQCYAVVRRNGIKEIWRNGELVIRDTAIDTRVVTSTSTILRVGKRSDGAGSPFDGMISLVRVTGTAPSTEQIAKIYNDEKHLFATNAKATLYGSSNAVTALAYDDDTELLHAGTSAGRSVFQGLNRVDNTTDAVGAAISASNGFIVEE